MAKLWIGRTALEGFNLFSHVGIALKVAWLPLVVATVSELAFSAAIVDATGHFESRSFAIEASGASGQVAEDRELESLFVFLGDIAWPALGLVVVTTAAYSMAFAGWMRFLLIGKQSGEKVPLVRFGGRELRFFIAYLIWSVLWLVLIGIVAAITYVLTNVSVLLAVVVGIPLAVMAVVLTARALLVFPMISLDQGMRWIAAWRLSRGNVWRLSLGLGLGFVLVLVALFLVNLLLPTFVDVPTLDNNAASIADTVIQQTASFMMFLILCGSVADAYRQLEGPGTGVPESVLAVFDG